MDTINDWVSDPRKKQTSANWGRSGLMLDGEALFRKTMAKQVVRDSGLGVTLWFSGCLYFAFAGGSATLFFLYLVVDDYGWKPIFVMAGITLGIVILLANYRTVDTVTAYRNPDKPTQQMIRTTDRRPLLPSEEELVDSALRWIIQQGGHWIEAPKGWMVDNQTYTESYTRSNIIFLTSTDLQSPYLVAVIAHQLIQNAQGNGITKVAMLANNTPQDKLPYADEWRSHWREQTFYADEQVARLGFKHEMIQYLLSRVPLEGSRPYLLQDKPSAPERIDRLRLLTF